MLDTTCQQSAYGHQSRSVKHFMFAGAMLTASDWPDVIPNFTPTNKPLYFGNVGLEGHQPHRGQTPSDFTHTQLNAAAEAVLYWRQKHPDDEIIVTGFSLGAKKALKVASMFPDCVNKLVLLNMPYGATWDLSCASGATMAQHAAAFPMMVHGGFAPHLQNQHTETLIERMLARHADQPELHAIHATLCTQLNATTEEIARVTAETMIVTGSDPLGGATAARTLQRHLSASTATHVLTDMDTIHWTTTQSEGVRRQVLQFLASEPEAATLAA